MTITIGIDLAASAHRTAAVRIAFTPTPQLVDATLGVDDAMLERLLTDRAAQRIGVDAPTGWPEAFVDAVARWPAAFTTAEVVQLRLRETDRFVHTTTGRAPISVSADRLAVVAMRLVRVLDRIGEQDVSGGGRIVESYPAGALRAWGIDARGYRVSVQTRRRVLAELGLPGDSTAGSEHLLDSVICAFVAQAARLGVTHTPDASQQAAARREGWIHLPRAGSLAAVRGVR